MQSFSSAAEEILRITYSEESQRYLVEFESQKKVGIVDLDAFYQAKKALVDQFLQENGLCLRKIHGQLVIQERKKPPEVIYLSDGEQKQEKEKLDAAIDSEYEEGLTIWQSNLFLNKPRKVKAFLYNELDEKYTYLVCFQKENEKYFKPAWIEEAILSKVSPGLIVDFYVEQMLRNQ